MSYSNINFFKDEESDKMSADSAHVQGTSGGESTDSQVASGSPFLDLLTLSMYFVFQHNITTFRYYIIDDYLPITSSIMRIFPN